MRSRRFSGPLIALAGGTRRLRGKTDSCRVTSGHLDQHFSDRGIDRFEGLPGGGIDVLAVYQGPGLELE